MLKLLVIIVLALAAVTCWGRWLTRCGLVRELRIHHFPEKLMRDWVCLVEHESLRRTDARGSVNRDGSRDYGLFMINDRYWCSNNTRPGKDCHVTCADIMTDNITKASTCAKKIYKRHKFTAWYGWLKYCKGKPLPDISNCTRVVHRPLNSFNY